LCPNRPLLARRPPRRWCSRLASQSKVPLRESRGTPRNVGFTGFLGFDSRRSEKRSRLGQRGGVHSRPRVGVHLSVASLRLDTGEPPVHLPARATTNKEGSTDSKPSVVVRNVWRRTGPQSPARRSAQGSDFVRVRTHRKCSVDEPSVAGKAGIHSRPSDITGDSELPRVPADAPASPANVLAR
jgi:hypothetical protein